LDCLDLTFCKQGLHITSIFGSQRKITIKSPRALTTICHPG